MIIHLFVPREEIQSIKDIEGKDFRIINWFYEGTNGRALFIVDTTDDQLTYYILKYGRNNAWKR